MKVPKDKSILSEKFEKFIVNLLGERPTRAEMCEVDKKTRKAFDKIYDEPNKNPQFIKEIYDKELCNLWGKAVAHEATFSEVELFLKYSNAIPGSSMASLASGIAVFELFIAKEIIIKGKVSCIDISTGMCNKAEEFLKKLKLTNVRIIAADITKLPIDSSSQDIVLARRTGLSNDKKWIEVLKEANRVLKKSESSRFIYTVDADFTKPKEEIMSNLQNAKLKLIKIDSFTKKDGERVDMIVAGLV